MSVFQFCCGYARNQLHPKTTSLIKLRGLVLWGLVLNLLLPSCRGSKQTPPTSRELGAFLQNQLLAREVKAFIRFLQDHNLESVVDPHQLLRQGTDYQQLGQPPFAIPPRNKWKSILPTLRFLRDELIPRIGDVEVVSGFRTPEYNRKAGGATHSQHLQFVAVDLIPQVAITRQELHQVLDRTWRLKGKDYKLGLGKYCGIRFHIDTGRFRKWKKCRDIGIWRRLIQRMKSVL